MRKKYQGFVAKGVAQVKQPELVGGGLVRSLAGSGRIGMNHAKEEDQLGDERILDDGDFVAAILAQSEATLTARERYRPAGFGLNELARVVATVLEIDPAEVRLSGKHGGSAR